MVRTSAQLKADARERLLGNYSKFIFALLLSNFLLQIVDNMIAGVTLGTKYYMQFALVSSIFLRLFSGLFTSGECYMYLRFAFGQPVRVFDIFQGFRVHVNKAILLQVIFTLVSVLNLVPLVFLRNNWREYDLELNLLLVGCLVAGYLIYILVSLNLSFAFYMLHDFPNLPLKKIIPMCIRLMKGYRWKLLRLELSFIPMYLLGVMTFFLGFLWIVPYIRATKTNFYIDLLETKTK